MKAATQMAPLADYTVRAGSPALRRRLLASLRYAFSTEVHTYAFAIAANVLIAFIPFYLLLLSICKNALHSEAAVRTIWAMLDVSLPANQVFIKGTIRSNLEYLMYSSKAQLLALGMLLFASSGVMLPLEVALNRIWGFAKNRSYVMNQLVSYGVALACGVLALLSVMLIAVNLAAINGGLMHFGWSGPARLFTIVVVKLISVPTSITIFFLVYYFMPNGKVPVRPVLLSAIVAGLTTETVSFAFARLLPWLDFPGVYGPFNVSVTLVMLAFVTSIVLLAGAHFSANGGGLPPSPAPEGPVGERREER